MANGYARYNGLSGGGGGGSGITSVNGATGPAITIAPGTGISVGTVGNTITITNTETPIPTFTEGSVIFAASDGSLTQDNANFFWDETNKYLGIGTNTPAHSLDVEVLNSSDENIFVAAQVSSSYTGATHIEEMDGLDVFNFITTNADVDSVYGIFGGVEIESTGTIQNAFGLNFEVSNFTDGGIINSVIASAPAVSFDAITSGIIAIGEEVGVEASSDVSYPDVYGIYAYTVLTPGSTITNQYGVRGETTGPATNTYQFYASNLGGPNGGTITNFCDFYGSSPALSGGTITNSYGLFLEDQAVGANNWAIKTGLGTVQFGADLLMDSQTGLGVLITANPTLDADNGDGGQQGFEISVNFDPSLGVGDSYNRVLQFVGANTSSVNVAIFDGVFGSVENQGSGTITDAVVIHAGGVVNISGAITNGYGVLIDGNIVGGGTVTNLWGLNIADVNQANNNWAIQTGLGTIQFGSLAGGGTQLVQTDNSGVLSGTPVSSFQQGPLTGDVTTSGAVATLATVNSNVGSFGSSTSIPTFTVNGKGLITAASGNAVIAPAGTLSGTTLNSTVVTSSLTSVGTITTGVWNGTAIDVSHGGTGLATLTANNVILGNGTSNPTFVAPGTSGNVLTSNGSTWTSAASSGSSVLVAVFNDTEAQNTGGGTPASTGTWLQRTINTTQTSQSFASLSSNQITLASGTYFIEASAPAYNTLGHQIRLFNVTASSVAILGSSEFAGASTVQNRSQLSGVIVVSGSTVFEIDHWVNQNIAASFGIAVNAASEIYTIISIMKLA